MAMGLSDSSNGEANVCMYSFPDYERILSFYYSIGSPIDGAHPGTKTDRDNLEEIHNHKHTQQLSPIYISTIILKSRAI